MQIQIGFKKTYPAKACRTGNGDHCRFGGGGRIDRHHKFSQQHQQQPRRPGTVLKAGRLLKGKGKESPKARRIIFRRSDIINEFCVQM